MSQINIKQIRGSSQGSILFLGTNSTVSEDLNSLNWNQSNKELTVIGTVSTDGLIITNGAQSGYILTSDSNGLTSWTSSNSINGVDGAVSDRWVIQYVDNTDPDSAGNLSLNSSTFSDISVLKIRPLALSGGDWFNYFNYLLIKQNAGYILRIQLTDVNNNSNFGLLTSTDGDSTIFGYQFNISTASTIFNGTPSVGSIYSVSWSLEAPPGATGATGSSSDVKSGYLVSASFSGNPLTASVSFDTDYADSNYTPSVIGDDSRSWSISNRTPSGFVINSNSSTSLTGNVYWTTTPWTQQPVILL